MRPAQWGAREPRTSGSTSRTPSAAPGGNAAVRLIPKGITADLAFLDPEAVGPVAPQQPQLRALASAARRTGRPAFATYEIRHSIRRRTPVCRHPHGRYP